MLIKKQCGLFDIMVTNMTIQHIKYICLEHIRNLIKNNINNEIEFTQQLEIIKTTNFNEKIINPDLILFEETIIKNEIQKLLNCSELNFEIKITILRLNDINYYMYEIIV